MYLGPGPWGFPGHQRAHNASSHKNHNSRQVSFITQPPDVTMTLLALDPSALFLFYPKATSAKPQKLRIIAQFVGHDDSDMIAIRRLPNLGPLHTEIDLSDENEDSYAQTDISDVQVDISQSAYVSSNLYESVGKVVSILGYYNGTIINAIECICLDEQALLGSSLDTLVTMATLDNL